MKGLQALRRGFSTSTIKQGRLQDPKNPGFLVPISKPGQVWSYENLIVKRMKKYLQPSKEWTHNRYRFGKQYVIGTAVLGTVYGAVNAYKMLKAFPFKPKA